MHRLQRCRCFALGRRNTADTLQCAALEHTGGWNGGFCQVHAPSPIDSHSANSTWTISCQPGRSSSFRSSSRNPNDASRISKCHWCSIEVKSSHDKCCGACTKRSSAFSPVDSLSCEACRYCFVFHPCAMVLGHWQGCFAHCRQQARDASRF